MSNPSFINPKRLGNGVAEGWYYEDRRGMDVLCTDAKDNVRSVRLTWGEIRKAMKRAGVRAEEPSK